MGAKLHHKKVSLMTRQEQLSHLDHDDVVIYFLRDEGSVADRQSVLGHHNVRISFFQ